MKAKGMTQQTTQHEVGEKSVSTAYREMLIVIRREVLTRTKNKTILLATGLLALTVGIGAGVGGWFLREKMGDASFQLDTRLLFATAMVSALLSSLVYSSQSLTSGVVEEKSSRVVEILLTKIGVVPLLAGKMIGIGAITLVQLLLIGGTGLLGFTLVDGWSLLELEVGLDPLVVPCMVLAGLHHLRNHEHDSGVNGLPAGGPECRSDAAVGFADGSAGGHPVPDTHLS